jgi:hypothetical protein
MKDTVRVALPAVLGGLDAGVMATLRRIIAAFPKIARFLDDDGLRLEA